MKKLFAAVANAIYVFGDGFCCSMASLSGFLSACSILCTVPTGFVAFRLVGGIGGSSTNEQIRDAVVLWHHAEPAALPLLKISSEYDAADCREGR
jgi:hypothetical protein